MTATRRTGMATCTDSDTKRYADDNLLSDTKTRRNAFPVHPHDSICLVVSSCFFLIPGCYAFYTALYFYGCVSFLTTLVSANYWRHAVHGWRRTADLITAKVSFAIYFISGCLFIQDPKTVVVGIPGCAMIIFCYYSSNRLWDMDSWTWVYFHMSFHLFVALEQFLVLYGGVEINAPKYLFNFGIK